MVQRMLKSYKKKGIHIWDGNASRECLDSIGLTDREEGDLGPVYGFQWRHFGARYTNVHADYTAQGFDQLLDVIDKIKNKPDDRRIILSAWNPSDLNLMALPPCHMFAQGSFKLLRVNYPARCISGLGVPFIIASYALLTCMIGQVCDCWRFHPCHWGWPRITSDPCRRSPELSQEAVVCGIDELEHFRQDRGQIEIPCLGRIYFEFVLGGGPILF